MKLYEYVLRVKDQASAQFDRLSKAAGVANTQAERMTQQLERTSRSSSLLTSTLRALAPVILATFSIYAVANFGREVVQTTARIQSLDNAIRFASGSSEEGNQNLTWLADTVDRMGLPLEASKFGFRTLAGAMMGSKLQGEQTRQIFEKVSSGIVTMGLDSETAKGAFLALGQMMGKGKVQAEELRGQLGERIPGAFQIAARAMGKTTAELDKMLVKGELMAVDFLPKFADEMQRTFGAGAVMAAQSLQSAINRMDGALLTLKTTIGTALEPMFRSLINNVTNVYKWFTALFTAGTELNNKFMAIVNILGQVAYFTGVAALAWGGYVLAAKLSVVWATLQYMWMMRLAIVEALTATATYGLRGAVMALNAAFAANPVGFVIAALIALAGILFWMYNKFDWFRGGVWGFWEAIKEVFASIADMAKNVFGGLADVIVGAFSFDTNLMKEGASKLTKGLLAANPYGMGAVYGSKIAEAAKRGYAEGLNKGPVGIDSFLGGFASTEQSSETPTTGSAAGASAGLSDITGGGGRVMQVTVNLGKMVEEITINAPVDDALQDIEERFKEMLARIINGGVYSATQ